MPRDYSSTELLASLRQRTFTAASSRDFDDASVYRVLNEMATTYLLKLIAKRRTNYLVETVDTAVTAGVPGYIIPSVAMAGALRSVVMIVGNIPYGLIEMDLPNAKATNMVQMSVQFPTGYYIEGAKLVPWPTQSLSGTLRISYHRRPSVIVATPTCVKITSLPAGAAAGFYRVGFTGTAPSGYTTSVAVDVVSNIPNFYRWQTNVALSNVQATTLDIPVNVDGVIPPNLQVGDWICLYDTAPVVTDAPAEVIEALLQKVAVKIMEAKGASDSLQRMKDGLAEAEADCGPLIQSRNTGAQRKLSAFGDGPAWPWSGM